MTPAELERMSPAERRHLEYRQQLWRTALEDALIAGDKIRLAMRDGKGVFWDSMAPLTPRERTLVLRELRVMWRLPLKS